MNLTFFRWHITNGKMDSSQKTSEPYLAVMSNISKLKTFFLKKTPTWLVVLPAHYLSFWGHTLRPCPALAVSKMFIHQLYQRIVKSWRTLSICWRVFSLHKCAAQFRAKRVIRRDIFIYIHQLNYSCRLCNTSVVLEDKK